MPSLSILLLCLFSSNQMQPYTKPIHSHPEHQGFMFQKASLTLLCLAFMRGGLHTMWLLSGNANSDTVTRFRQSIS